MGTRALDGAVETMPGLVVRPEPVAGASAMPASFGDELEMVRMEVLLRIEEVARMGTRAAVGLATQIISLRAGKVCGNHRTAQRRSPRSCDRLHIEMVKRT